MEPTGDKDKGGGFAKIIEEADGRGGGGCQRRGHECVRGERYRGGSGGERRGGAQRKTMEDGAEKGAIGGWGQERTGALAGWRGRR